MLFLAPYTVASLSIQWGNNVWPMFVIWTLGSIIIWRLKRFHITLAYVVAFVAFAFIRSIVTGHTFLSEVAPITGPMYQLFIFFMITDPKTTVRSSKLAQCGVAVAVARRRDAPAPRGERPRALLPSFCGPDGQHDRTLAGLAQGLRACRHF